MLINSSESEMSDCLSPDELQRFLAGTLSPEREATVSTHFEQCEDCQRLADAALDWGPVDACRAVTSCGDESADEDGQSEKVFATLHKLVRPVSVSPASSARIAQIPERIGSYRVLRLLAQGGTGAVYLATQSEDEGTATEPGTLVAIKVLTPECVARPLHRKRFERERNVLTALPPHRNVVRVFDSCLTDEMRYLVMEYAGGKNLWQSVAAQSLIPIDDACRLILQVADGLQHIHAHGLVHRDIKPSNLIVDDHETVKIVDFGIVHYAEVEQLESRLTEANTLMGTADFMAPEQATDVRNVGPAADTYSPGCTLAWLLTGQLVFERKNLAETLIAHRRETVPSIRERRADIPLELDVLFQKMVAKLPEDRPETMIEVIAELHRILSSFGDAGNSVSSAQSRKRRFGLGAVAVSLIVLVVLVAIAVTVLRHVM